VAASFLFSLVSHVRSGRNVILMVLVLEAEEEGNREA
jgi:hypothetical protein